MSIYRNNLPQMTGEIFLTDAGLETDLIFNKDIEIREFAAHTLLPEDKGRAALEDYLKGFLELADKTGTGIILDSPTWKAHMHWAQDLDATEGDLQSANQEAVDMIASLRKDFSNNTKPIVLNGVVGPRGDAYAPDQLLSVVESRNYHAQQLSWLAKTAVDMVTALTFTQADEATGFVLAAKDVSLPCVVSFTVETDGNLPTGQSMASAIEQVDKDSDGYAAYFMINCAHPDHFSHLLGDEPWARRIRGIRCNASRMSHAELDECETLDDGNPHEFGSQYRQIKETMPWLNVFGGCCGSDLRHVTEIANSVTN
jgi:S-methylmethionine-dependent homocysteine/selenocysteine methylase